MDTVRTIKKYQFILMFVIVIILFLPVTGMSFQIIGKQITRVGDVIVNCDQYGCRYSRPVMVRATYSCDNNPGRLFSTEVETIQIKDRWGEWNIFEDNIKNAILNLCGKEISRSYELLMTKIKKSMDKGDFKTALVNINKGLEQYPKLNELYDARGNIYNTLGKYNESIANSNKAIELNPKNATAYNNRGFAYTSLGKYSEAIADFTKAIELNPKNAMAYSNRGAVYNTLKNIMMHLVISVEQLNSIQMMLMLITTVGMSIMHLVIIMMTQ